MEQHCLQVASTLSVAEMPLKGFPDQRAAALANQQWDELVRLTARSNAHWPVFEVEIRRLLAQQERELHLSEQLYWEEAQVLEQVLEVLRQLAVG